MDQKTGSAFAVYQDGEEISHVSVRLNDEATVYIAELNGIDLAVNYVLEHNYVKVDIITDSWSVLQALSNPTNSCPLIWRLKGKLKNSTSKISLKWTKAHIGTLENESADVYAKYLTTKEEIDIYFKIPTSFVKRLINQEIRTDWQTLWRDSVKGRPVYSIFPKVNLKRVQGIFTLIKSSRDTVPWLIIRVNSSERSLHVTVAKKPKTGFI
ncbi:uncharacterized protein CEXT_638731 [Caerostris extrusa]|uniref:RNase H type-1 domain-containing protein n=1 Tax=Caerostris extrusa TaxID=172846 RepID=A0AAV4XHT1_CAEEX|nr:uncharacterized protein CEXT_638731 [Caerostris extrusa]